MAIDAAFAQAGVLAERVARCLDRPLAGWRPVAGGYSVARRLVVSFSDGTSVFVKGATDRYTAKWLRAEHGVYAQVKAAFLPAMLAWEDDGDLPFLVLEDLSAALWQAPWTESRIALVLETLRQVAGTHAPAFLPSMKERWSAMPGWVRVKNDPAPFLALGVCSAAWLSGNIDALVEAEASADLDGESLVHGDIRSDNLCFIGDRVIIVDWNWAARGNGDVELATWLPSLHLEGGPLPDSVLPGHAGLAARVGGYFAAVAGLSPEKASVQIRALQLAQLRVALPWALRATGITAIL